MNGDGPGHEEAEYEEEDDLDDDEDDEDGPEYEEDDDEDDLDEDDEDEEETEYEEDEQDDGDKPAPLKTSAPPLVAPSLVEEAAVARKRKGVPIHGWLVIDKPPGMTSTQVMARVRRLLNAEKAGHGGTLDPIATGVCRSPSARRPKPWPMPWTAPKPPFPPALG